MSMKPCLIACAVAAALAGTPFAVVHAETPAAEPGKLTAEELDKLIKFSIVGLGETRQVQRLDPSEAERYPAGTSLLKLLDRLPGVHFTNADPWGSYGWAKRLSIRGFNQFQLGFTLDRVPLGDQNYANSNGLHVSRAMIVENLGVLELSQGGGTLDTASTSNLGGTIRIVSDEPGYEQRIRLDQTLGSDHATRTYARLDTGDFRGWRSFISAVHHDTDKWKGFGPQRQSQVNLKTTREFGSAVFTAYYNATRRGEDEYADLSLTSQRTRGWGWDNYAPDWERAITAAIELCAAFGGTRRLECDDAYYNARSIRHSDLGYMSLDWTINERFGLITTVYGHKDDGQGHWAFPGHPGAMPVSARVPGMPIVMRVSEYYIDRYGVLPTLTWFYDNHKIEAGFWIERNQHDFYRNFYPLQRNDPPDRVAFFENPSFRHFAATFDIDTLTYFVQDRINLQDGRLTVDVGFKGVDVDYDTTPLYGTQFARGQINAKDSFLPKAAVRYGFSNEMEGFLAYSENISVYRAGVRGVFDTTQAGFDAVKNRLKPESSRTIEGGIRSVTERLEGSIIAYDVLFENRLLRIAQGPGILAGVGTLVNVGSVKTQGIEAAALWRINDGLSWYNSIAYNDSKYQDNYVNGTTVVPTAGKRVVDSPKWLASSNLHWTIGNWDLRLGAKYTDERFYSYTNDAGVDSYTVVNLSLIYRLTELSWANAAKIQFNVTNLFDDKHFSTIGTNPYPEFDPNGTNWNLMEGAPRQFFVTASFDF